MYTLACTVQVEHTFPLLGHLTWLCLVADPCLSLPPSHELGYMAVKQHCTWLTHSRENCRSTSFHCSALYTCESEEEEEEGYSLELNANTANTNTTARPTQLSASAPATVTCSNLLGSFEECVLNGRLEPVSTVQGFTAEIAASGAFCPKRTTKPVTVFFYTLCDNDQISSPYMVRNLDIQRVYCMSIKNF